VVAIAFPRYLRDTIAVAEQARSSGARILALTDSISSPLRQLADISLYINAYRRMAANSDAIVLAVIQGLCGAVAHRVPKSAQAAASMTQATLPWLYRDGCKPAGARGRKARRAREPE
jgi:DNA-binding MurR/RpiR family transcriptional regulator